MNEDLLVSFFFVGILTVCSLWCAIKASQDEQDNRTLYWLTNDQSRKAIALNVAMQSILAFFFWIAISVVCISTLVVYDGDMQSKIWGFGVGIVVAVLFCIFWPKTPRTSIEELLKQEGQAA